MKKFFGAVLTVLACTAAYKHYDAIEGKALAGVKLVKNKVLLVKKGE